MPGFLPPVGAEDLNPGPRAHTANTLLSKPPRTPLPLFFHAVVLVIMYEPDAEALSGPQSVLLLHSASGRLPSDREHPRPIARCSAQDTQRRRSPRGSSVLRASLQGSLCAPPSAASSAKLLRCSLSQRISSLLNNFVSCMLVHKYTQMHTFTQYSDNK